MNTELNDPKLCLAMARLLSLKLIIYEQDIYWSPTQDELTKGEYLLIPVLDNEWLYVMHLVEDTLKDGPDAGAEKYQYAHALYRVIPKGRQPCCATFNQRARAMCEVKGIVP